MSFLICLVIVFALLSMGVVFQLIRAIVRFAFEVLSLVIRLVFDVVHLAVWIVASIANNLASIIAILGVAFAFVVSRIASSLESWIDDDSNRRRRSTGEQDVDQVAPSSEQPPRLSFLSEMAWSWVAPSCVLATFVLLSDTTNNQLEDTMAWARSVILKEPNSRVQQLARDQLVPTLWTEPVRISTASDKRPEWTFNTRSTVGDIQSIVVSSRLWSTEAEAAAELNPEVVRLVKADFESNHHGFLDPKRWLPANDDQVARVAVTERFLETTEQDFGSFKAPMYRLWYHVQLSPIVRTNLYPVWKAAVAKNRIIALGAGLALMTLLANLVWMASRLRSSTTLGHGFAFGLAVLTAGVWIPVSFSVIRNLLC